VCYRPWFHSRFAKASVALPRQAVFDDLRMISASAHASGGNGLGARKPARKSQPETWVGCDACGKWRRLTAGASIDPDAVFVCSMLSSTACNDPEEDWDDDSQWVETSGNPAGASTSSSRSRPPSVSPCNPAEAAAPASLPRSPPRSPVRSVEGRTRKRRAEAEPAPGAAGQPAASRRRTSAHPSDESSSDESGAARPGANGGTTAPMSRLEAVIEVLGQARTPMHYDTITQQALRVGLIRFTGSQGTAGESMKAFLNKTIRENKCPSVVNLGKGVYGLRDWGMHADARGATGPSPVAGVRPFSSSANSASSAAASATPSPNLRPAGGSASPAPATLALSPAVPAGALEPAAGPGTPSPALAAQQRPPAAHPDARGRDKSPAPTLAATLARSPPAPPSHAPPSLPAPRASPLPQPALPRSAARVVLTRALPPLRRGLGSSPVRAVRAEEARGPQEAREATSRQAARV
jgi:hypothetical protein